MPDSVQLRIPQRKYLPGMPWAPFLMAARLPGRALHVWVLAERQAKLRRQRVVTLPAALLAAAGVSPDAKVRALRHLQDAGLVRIEWGQGRTLRITLLDI